MSDDLISRKYLLGIEQLLMTDVVKNNPAARYVLEQVLYDIENAPTAYDLDKVVDQLEQKADDSRKYWQEFDDEDAFGEMNAYSKAIEIVKSGGVAND